MYTKMDKIDIYNDSAIILEKKTPKKIISWITILIILTLIFLFLSFLPFNLYKTKVGYVDIVDNNSYIVLPIDESDFPVHKNKKLFVKNKKYNYKIMKLESDKLILKINLDNNLKIQNNIVKLNIIKDRTTLFKIIKNKIKKGFEI